MAMVYDLPQASPTAAPMKQFDAPQAKNVAAEQGQQMGAALVNAGNTTTNIMTDIQHNIDTATTKEMDNRLSDVIRSTLHDPEKGYMAQVGKGAIDSRSGAIKNIQDAVEQLQPGLTNDVQKYMFKQAANARINQALGQIDTHAMQQTKVYNMGETEARMEGFRKDAEASIGDKVLFEQAKTNMLREAQDYAQLAGFGPDQSKKYQLAASTKMNINVIDQLLAGDNAKLAKEYFAEYRKEIDPDLYDNIGKKVDDAVAHVDGRDFAIKTFTANMPKDVNDPLAEDKMFKAIETSGLDANGKKYAHATMQDQISIYSKQKTQFAHAASNQVFGMMTNDGDRGQYNKVLNFINQQTNIDETAKHSLKSAADHFYHISEDRALAKQAAMIDRKIQMAIKAENFVDGYMNGDFGKMTKQQVLGTYGAELGEQVFRAAGIVDKINNKLENPKLTMSQFNQKLQTMYAIPEFKKVLGFDPNSKDAKDKKMLLLDYTLDALSNTGAKGPGKQVSLDYAISEGLKKIKTQDTLFGIIPFGTKEVEAYRVPTLPESEKRSFVVQRLKQAGKPVNDQTVNQALKILNKTRTTSIAPALDEE